MDRLIGKAPASPDTNRGGGPAARVRCATDGSGERIYCPHLGGSTAYWESGVGRGIFIEDNLLKLGAIFIAYLPDRCPGGQSWNEEIPAALILETPYNVLLAQVDSGAASATKAAPASLPVRRGRIGFKTNLKVS